MRQLQHQHQAVTSETMTIVTSATTQTEKSELENKTSSKISHNHTIQSAVHSASVLTTSEQNSVIGLRSSTHLSPNASISMEHNDPQTEYLPSPIKPYDEEGIENKNSQSKNQVSSTIISSTPNGHKNYIYESQSTKETNYRDIDGSESKSDTDESTKEIEDSARDGNCLLICLPSKPLNREMVNRNTSARISPVSDLVSLNTNVKSTLRFKDSTKDDSTSVNNKSYVDKAKREVNQIVVETLDISSLSKPENTGNGSESHTDESTTRSDDSAHNDTGLYVQSKQLDDETGTGNSSTNIISLTSNLLKEDTKVRSTSRSSCITKEDSTKNNSNKSNKTSLSKPEEMEYRIDEERLFDRVRSSITENMARFITQDKYNNNIRGLMLDDHDQNLILAFTNDFMIEYNTTRKMIVNFIVKDNTMDKTAYYDMITRRIRRHIDQHSFQDETESIEREYKEDVEGIISLLPQLKQKIRKLQSE